MPLQGPRNFLTASLDVRVTEHGIGTELIDPAEVGNRMSCALVHIEPNKGFDLHTHPSDHLIMVQSGGGHFTYFEGGVKQQFNFTKGDVFASPKDMPHAVTAGPQGVTFIAVGTPARTLRDPERTHYMPKPSSATVS